MNSLEEHLHPILNQDVGHDHQGNQVTSHGFSHMLLEKDARYSHQANQAMFNSVKHSPASWSWDTGQGSQGSQATRWYALTSYLEPKESGHQGHQATLMSSTHPLCEIIHGHKCTKYHVDYVFTVWTYPSIGEPEHDARHHSSHFESRKHTHFTGRLEHY